MSFANPMFFWALLGLAVPILIHLFRFRRFRTVYFTNIKFLQELRKETHSRSRLRHLLILLMRCLAIIALVFAFARPYLPGAQKAIIGTSAISIYIDNSFSMNARGESSSLFELAKKQALDIVASSKPSDRFQLITNDFEGRHQRLLSAEQFNEQIQEVQLSPAVRKISEVITRQSDLLKHSAIQNKIIYLVSDFQAGSSDFNSTKPDTGIRLNCIHLNAVQADNISIDSVWFEKPFREKDKPETVQLRASNRSAKRFDDVPVKLIADGAQRGLESLSLGADSTSNSQLVFTASGSGFHSAYVELNDFPIVFDDRYYISWNTPEQIKVLCINGGSENSYLNQLFLRNKAFEYKNVSALQLDYTSLSQQQCIILHEIGSLSSGISQELKKFIQNGGSVLVFPSLNSDLASWGAFLSSIGAGTYGQVVHQEQKVGMLNSHHPIYDDVFEKKPEGIDLPLTRAYLQIKPGQGKEESIMRLQNGERFLTQFDVGKGKIYLTSSPLNEEAGNFQKHALFIPTIYKIALYSFPAVQLSYTLGEGKGISIGSVALGADQTLRMRSLDEDLEIIPEHRVIDGNVWIYPGNRIKKAGSYKVLQGSTEVARVSFNYSRQESSSERLSSSVLEETLQDAGWTSAQLFDGNQKEIRQAISDREQGKSLWKLFVILALIFLAAESIIIRLVK